MRIVAVTEEDVSNPEWREELKEWANLMEGRFGEEETPVGPKVTKAWIEYVEELEQQIEELEGLADEWYRHQGIIGVTEDAEQYGKANGIAMCADQLKSLIEEYTDEC